MRAIKILLFLIILSIGIFLRFYNIDKIPPGLNADEASLGYDAYSLLLTGKDQYGKAFPVFLRSFGAYQSSLYAYLSTIPVALFGLTIFSARFISALSGILLIIVTFFFVFNRREKTFWLGIITVLIVAISPWSIFFSRTAVEANLGLILVSIAAYFLLKFFERPRLLIIASVLLGISTYAYQAQRLGSVLFLLSFILIFVKQVIKKKKLVLISLILFILIQIPQLMLINTQAGTRRLDQVNYFSNEFFQQNGGNFKNLIFGRQFYILNEFSNHYLAYYSPKNLFFESDPQKVRSIPDLSVFFGWMLIPFLFGIKMFWEKRKEFRIKILLLLMVTGVIPAALTREPFYTLRALPLLWVLSIMIAYGAFKILNIIHFSFSRLFLVCMIILFSISILYLRYFVLLKYERSSDYGLPFIELARKSEELSSKKFIVDSGRQSQYYIWFAFFRKYDPAKLQAQGKDVLRDYYNAVDFDGRRIIGNVEIRPIDWGKDPCVNQIIVGDDLAISKAQAEEHGLSFKFGIPDLTGKVRLEAYSTNPGRVCR